VFLEKEKQEKLVNEIQLFREAEI